MLPQISHNARVVSLPSQGRAVVRLARDGVGASGCVGCKISALCARTPEMELTVDVPPGLTPAVGDDVLIEAPAALSRKAVVIVLLVPLAVLLCAVVCAVYAGLPEVGAACAGLVGMTAAFLALYRYCHLLNRQSDWNITKIYTD